MQARNGLCSLIVAVPQSEGWHWHLQPRNVTLITLGSCSGRLIVEQEPSGFRPSWLQIGIPGQVRRGPVPLPELPPPYQVLVWSSIWGDHLGNFSDHSQGRCGRAAVVATSPLVSSPVCRGLTGLGYSPAPLGSSKASCFTMENLDKET